MVRSIGLDIVDLDRIEKNITQYGDRFISKILSEREQQILERRHDRTAFLAGRFAAKEAVIKALGEFLTDRPAFSDLEILRGNSGEPILELPQDIQSRLSDTRCLLSISHSQTSAAAVAVFTEVV